MLKVRDAGQGSSLLVVKILQLSILASEYIIGIYGKIYIPILFT